MRYRKNAVNKMNVVIKKICQSNNKLKTLTQILNQGNNHKRPCTKERVKIETRFMVKYII